MKYRSEDVDLLLQQLKIEEVVGEFVELKKSGANYKGLCPFHHDNNPSFMVSPTKNICKCFVCGAGGNPINFYSKYKKISYNEAIEELAKKYNIAIKGYENIKKSENSEYYNIMESAHNYFKEEIFKNSGRVALEYLLKRKITPKLIQENEIGYAPGGWNGLYDYLINEGHSKEKIKELGLIKENENGIYDSFRNRVIFPIYSISGKVIAFGGRSLEEGKDIPKYINSPETPIFIKGNNLYGFVQKGSNIRKKNYSFLMEGYMDVLSAHSYGFDVALAPLGTALTEEQAKLLKRYTNNIILSFDMDEPGQKATERAIMILKSVGFNIRVLLFKDAKDPDEYLKKYGKDEFLKRVKESKEAFDYLFELYSKEYNLDDLMSKQTFVNRFKEFFQCLENDLEKELYIDKLGKSLNIDIGILKKILIIENQKKYRNKHIERNEKKEIDEKSVYNLERMTLALLLEDNEYFKDYKNKIFQNQKNKRIFDVLLEVTSKEKEKNQKIKKLLSSSELDTEEKEEIINISILFGNISEIKEREKISKMIFLDWFALELREKMRNRENILKQIMLKKIENDLKFTDDFLKIKELYKKFKSI